MTISSRIQGLCLYAGLCIATYIHTHGPLHSLIQRAFLIWQTFRMVEYEDELDLLAVVVTNGEEGEGRAHIRLHDNQSGRLLRTVDLVEPWDEVSDLLWLHRHYPAVSVYLDSCVFLSSVADLSTRVVLWQRHNCSYWTKEHQLLLPCLQAQGRQKISGAKVN